jgi:two-component system, NarL family, sensor kinase
MHPRSRTRLAWLVFGATFACLVGGLVVTLFVTRPLTAQVLVNGAFEGAIWLLFATIGLILTLRRPGNPIGWLYAGAGLAWTLSIPWDPWVDQLLSSNRPLPPAAQLAALAGDSLWAVGLTMAVTLPLLLLPNGRLRSPRWRPVAVASVAGTAATVVGWVLAPDPMTQTIRPVPKPFPLHGMAGTVVDTIHWIGWGVLFACIPVAAVSLVLRFRASRGTERQQLRWVAAGATGAVAGPVVGSPAWW